MAKKQTTYTPDIGLLARVFIRYRSGLDVNFPECREIVALLAEAGLDVENMETHEILALYPAPEVEEIPAHSELAELAVNAMALAQVLDDTEPQPDDDIPEGD